MCMGGRWYARNTIFMDGRPWPVVPTPNAGARMALMAPQHRACTELRRRPRAQSLGSAVLGPRNLALGNARPFQAQGKLFARLTACPERGRE